MQMSCVRTSTGLLLCAVVIAGCDKKLSTATQTNSVQGQMPEKNTATGEIDPMRGHLLKAQARLPTIKLWLGAEEVAAEIARQPAQIATGMMFRTNLLENEAMLFVFPGPDRRNFYMRNCVVPLSAAYIGSDGVILEIIKLQPGDEIGVPSQSTQVQFVLESPQGWYERHNVRTGMVVRTERGSLLDTFFRRNQR
jgi:hypothetical protein